MTKILILVCSLSTPIEDCSQENAISTARGPDVHNFIMCGFFGQSQLAQSALKPQKARWTRRGIEGEYEKVVCTTGGAG